MPTNRPAQISFYVPRPLFEQFHKLFPEKNAKTIVFKQFMQLCCEFGKGHRFIDFLRDEIERRGE